jgi:fructokinase
MSFGNITAIGEILFDVYPNQKKIGGAPFNFIYHVHKFTNKAKFITRIGSDEEGNTIIKFLQKQNFPTEFIQTNLKKPTGVVTVKLNDLKTPEFYIEQDVAYDYIELNDAIRNAIIEHSDLIYFGTLCQRSSISKKSIQSLFGKSKFYFCDINLRRNCFTASIIEESLHACNILKINEEELGLISKTLIGYNFNLKENAKIIKNKFNIDYVCVTRGKDGAAILNDNSFVECKHKVDNLLDTVGAGDAYSAVLAVGILMNIDLEKINCLATSFAAEICSIHGALPADDEIYSKYKDRLLNG